MGLAHAIYRETDGNPFFVSEVLRNLVETGAIRQSAEGRWEPEATLDVTALPDSVREVIGARVLRLGKEAGRFLSVAAVIGRDFDLDLLAAATNSEVDDVLDVLDEAGTVSLVRELTDTPGHFTFAHALIQRTLYEDLGPTRRARAHRHVAEALGGLRRIPRHTHRGAGPALVLCHPAHRPDEAIGYRGWPATRHCSPWRQGMHCGTTRRRWTSVRRWQRWTRCSPSISASGWEPRSARPVTRPTGTPSSTWPTRRQCSARTTAWSRRSSPTTRIPQQPLRDRHGEGQRIGARPRSTPWGYRDRALVLALLCQELTIDCPLERRQALADEAIAIAEASGDDATMVRVLNAVMHPLGVPHLIEQTLRWSDEALDRSQRLGDPVLLFWTLAYRVFYSTNAGDLDERDRCLANVETLADQLNQPILDWSSGFLAAAKAQIAGDNDLADQLAGRAYESATESGQADALLVYGGLGATVGSQRGSVTDWIEVWEQLSAESTGITGEALAPALASMHTLEGNLDEAQRLLDRCRAGGFDILLDFVWLSHMVECAHAAMELGDAVQCPAPLRRVGTVRGHAAQFRCRIGGSRRLPPRWTGCGARQLRRLRSVLRPRGTFQRALRHQVLRRRDPVLEGEDADQLHDGPGDVERARVLLDEARSAASTYGYGAIERRAADILQTLG